MRAVLSVDAVTMREPSGLKAAELVAAVCPRRRCDLLTRRGFEDARGPVGQPPDDVTMRAPSGLKAAEVNRALGTSYDRDLAGRFSIPDVRAPVMRAVTISAPSGL